MYHQIKENPANRKIVLLISLVLLVFVSFATFQFIRNLGFRQVSISPSLNEVSVIGPYIKINFNKDLAGDISVESDDPVLFGHSVDKNILTIELQSMVLKKQYAIHISNIKSASGDKLDDINLYFNAKDIPFNGLSKEEQKFILAKQDTPTTKNDPIISDLPYGTTNFNLNAVIGASLAETRPELSAEIILSSSDVRSGEKEQAINAAKQDINDYIKSLNLNPEDYKITYSITEPNLY